MPEVTAAGYLAVIGALRPRRHALSGWLTDRYDPRLLLFWFYGLRGLSLLVLHSVLGAPNAGLLVFVVFYGLDWVATVPPTVALTADIFGREHVGVVFGWIFAAHQLGAAAAALGAGADPRRRRLLPLGLPDRGRALHGRLGRGDAHPAAAGRRAGARLRLCLCLAELTQIEARSASSRSRASRIQPASSRPAPDFFAPPNGAI